MYEGERLEHWVWKHGPELMGICFGIMVFFALLGVALHG
jgi:hypothetical protein